VSLGLVAACNISVRRAGLSATERDEVIAVLGRLGLPTKLPGGLERGKIMEAITRDKKFEDGEIRFVVTPQIGRAFLSRDVTIEDIREAVAELS
jgi:3-dehydroquinate synthase